MTLIFYCVSTQAAEAAYNLPAGVKEQTGLAEIKENFKCEAEGYFAGTREHSFFCKKNDHQN